MTERFIEVLEKQMAATLAIGETLMAMANGLGQRGEAIAWLGAKLVESYGDASDALEAVFPEVSKIEIAAGASVVDPARGKPAHWRPAR